MVFKIISVGSIPATLVILLFKFSPRKTQTNKHRKVIFSPKAKTNLSKFRKQYLHSGDFIKSEAFHKGTLSNSYKLNHCFLTNIINTLSLYHNLNKFCSTFSLLVAKGQWTAFTKVTSSPMPFTSPMSTLLPFFTSYNRDFNYKHLGSYSEIAHTSEPVNLGAPYNFRIRTNVFSS